MPYFDQWWFKTTLTMIKMSMATALTARMARGRSWFIVSFVIVFIVTKKGVSCAPWFSGSAHSSEPIDSAKEYVPRGTLDARESQEKKYKREETVFERTERRNILASQRTYIHTDPRCCGPRKCGINEGILDIPKGEQAVVESEWSETQC